MAYETLYFFISIVLLLGSIFLVASMMLYRLTGRSVLGERINQKHPAYESMKKFSSRLNITLATMATLVLMLNMYFGIRRLLDLNTQDARIVLWIAPIIGVIGLMAIFIDMRNKFKK